MILQFQTITSYDNFCVILSTISIDLDDDTLTVDNSLSFLSSFMRPSVPLSHLVHTFLKFDVSLYRPTVIR